VCVSVCVCVCYGGGGGGLNASDAATDVGGVNPPKRPMEFEPHAATEHLAAPRCLQKFVLRV
jgi:hypothetical protein